MKVLRRMRYGEIKIYFLQHKRFFQYLFHYKDQIYMQWAKANPQRWYGWLRPLLGKPMLTEKEVHDAETSLAAGAKKSIDELNEKTKKSLSGRRKGSSKGRKDRTRNDRRKNTRKNS